MRSKKWIVLASAALAGVLAIPAVAFAGGPGNAGPGRAGTVEVPVSFTVHNTNNTTVACTTAHGIGYEATHLQTVDIINRWLHDHHG